MGSFNLCLKITWVHIKHIPESVIVRTQPNVVEDYIHKIKFHRAELHFLSRVSSAVEILLVLAFKSCLLVAFA